MSIKTKQQLKARANRRAAARLNRRQVHSIRNVTMPRVVFEAVDLLADTLVSGTLYDIRKKLENSLELDEDDKEFLTANRKAAEVYETWAGAGGLR